ncbi:MAG TPA: hypothetical protein VFJ24_07865 [Gaiellales bacterium]|nr:hypothetical protein [Gaiellales bacterium]
MTRLRSITGRRPRLLVTIVMLIAALATACGGSSGGPSSGTESPGAFIQQVTTQFSRGQSGRLWDELYPPDQAVVSRSRFMRCQGNQGFRLKSFKVLETYNDSVDVEGKAEKAEAVTVQVTSDDGVTTATVHAVNVGGTWHWILSPAQRAAYRSGKCP